MQNRRYPPGLFLTGMLLTAVVRLFWLFVPGLLLLAAGIFSRPFLK